MHENAGRLRRRRMLLLFQHQRPVEGPALVSAEASPLSADQEYLKSCGSEVRYAIVVEDLARRVLRQQPIDGPVFQIGQGPHNDLWLKHERIQSRHLLLVRLPEGIYFIALSPDTEVLGPKGGMKSGWWTQGLVLRVGSFRLRLIGARKQISAEDPLAISSSLEQELPRLELQFLGAAPRKAWPVTRTLTLLGRSAVCKIRLDHEEILPVEAALIRTAGRLWLINLSDADRVLVNETPILSARLDVGDRAGIGEFRVEVQTAEEWPLVTQTTAKIPSLPIAFTEPSRPLDDLVEECAQQHRKILLAQQQALQNLELLAGQAENSSELKKLLEQIRQSNAALTSEQRRLREKLQQAAPDEPN